MESIQQLMPLPFVQRQSVPSSFLPHGCIFRRSCPRDNLKIMSSNNMAAYLPHFFNCYSGVPNRTRSCYQSLTNSVRHVSGLCGCIVHCHATTSGNKLELANDLHCQVALPQCSSESSTIMSVKSSCASSTAQDSQTDNKQIQQEELTTSSSKEEEEDIEIEKGYQMSRVCDRLIEVFMIEKPKADEWRKLLAFSEEWIKIRPYFFKRCKLRANSEAEPERKLELLKLARRLKEVDDGMERHNQLLAHVEEHISDLDLVVAKHRRDFTNDFFEHLQLLCNSSYKNPDRRDEIASIAAKCLATVEAHDSAAKDNEALNKAQLKFQDILNSPSLEAACNKIDKLAKKKQLDSALMLVMTKAWAAAKESNMMKEEVKDIMYHLYMVARGNLQRLVPKEVRIMRHILSIEDPREQIAALTDAFSPGDELESKHVDELYTTPEKMHKWITTILDAYYTNKESTLMESARQLMNPKIISQIEFLKQVVKDQYM